MPSPFYHRQQKVQDMLNILDQFDPWSFPSTPARPARSCERNKARAATQNAHVSNSKVENKAQLTNGEMQIQESDQAYEVFLSLPGLQKDSLSVKLEGNQLLLEAQQTTSLTGAQDKLVQSAVEVVKETAHDDLVVTESDDLESSTLDPSPLSAAAPASTSTIVNDGQHVSESTDTWYLQHSLMLPSDVDKQHITARYQDGVLSLLLPKVQAVKEIQMEIPVM
jgi:HSP20 family molecular chaperone IbpA